VSGEVTIVSASVPTRISVNSMPLEAQSSASESLIAREAFENCVSPTPQNRSKPPPEPEMERLTTTPGWTAAYSSAMASVSGPTVDDPSISMVPSSGAASGAVSYTHLRAHET